MPEPLDGPSPSAPAPGWREVRVVDRTGSTNADLAALAGRGEPGGLVLVAREQTQGRGRLGRTWTSPPGTGLMFSVLLRPVRDTALLGWVPLLAGVAVAQALRDTTGVPAALKWPNDVVAGPEGAERKLAGLLAERVAGAVVLGVGVNVSMTADELPVPTATSLSLEGARTLDHGVLLEALLAGLAGRYAGWDGARPDADDELREAYRALCCTIGRTVRAELPGGAVVEGLAQDVDATGRLHVRTATGTVVAVGAGDVVHLHAGAPPAP